MENIIEALNKGLASAANLMWDIDCQELNERYCFSSDTLPAAAKIFITVLLDSMYDNPDFVVLSPKEREEKVFEVGSEIRNLIFSATGKNMHDAFK